MVNLNNLSAHEKYDLSGMIDHLRRFPVQLLDGWRKGHSLRLPAVCKQVDKVVIAGMGGSAIGGEVAAGLLAMESAVPLWVHRDFGLPGFVDAKTLAIAVSYSGNTKETLSAYDALAKTPAIKVVLTSGGRLAQLAWEQNVPVVVVDYQAPPRAAFAYMFGALVGILSRAGISRLKTADLQNTAAALERMSGELDLPVPLKSNIARQLAEDLCGKIPVIYGAGALAGVARRWKTQFNENSKSWAFFEVFPELVHNAIAAYSVPPWAKERLFAVLLQAPFLNPRVMEQYDAVVNLLSADKIPHYVIGAEGDSALTQVLSTVMLGDFTSYYLAILNKVDPTPLPAVDYVKQYMAKLPEKKG